MDDGPEGRTWAMLRNLFRKNGRPLEETILDARAEGGVKAEDVDMLLNILELGETEVQEIMVPRRDMVCADVDDGIPGVAELISAHGHSRIPVYQDNKDHILGVVHAKDLLKPLAACGKGAPDLRTLLRPPFFIPETTAIKDLLRQFQARRQHLAIVLDPYGGTSGLVTMEDVLEEIVGDIADEYDALRPEDMMENPDGSLLVSGRTSLEDLSERLSIRLESEQVETIGGFLSELSGRIPRKGEVFELEGLSFTVMDADAKQVRAVLVGARRP